MSSCAYLHVALHSPLRKGIGALFITLMAGSCHAAESTIRVYAESFAADSRVVETSAGTTVEGYASDFVRAVLTQAGYTADINVVPWPRLVNLLDSSPNVLGFNVTRTAEREDRYHWIGEIRPVTFQLWGLDERIGEFPQTLEEAQSLRVSAYRNDVVEQYLLGKGFANLVYVYENYDPIRMLRRRRIDLLPFSRFAMADLMSRQEGIRDELVPIFDLEDISTAHYLVMSKSSDPVLVQRIQQAFQALVDNGVHQEILGDTLSR